MKGSGTPMGATVTTPADREIATSRVVDAPRERVWRAFTEPDRVARWWGRGHRLDGERPEGRRGGHWRFVEHAPDGTHGFEGRYREVAPPERLAMTFDWDGNPGHVSVTTFTFEIDCTFDAPVAGVFAAWADPAAKARWFAGPRDQWTEIARRQDFRVGGTEHAKGRFAGGPTSTIDAIYLDVVPDARIVYTYTMHLDAVKISVSLATVAFEPDGARTRLVITEQGAFLDGYDDAGQREDGTRGLHDNLAAALRAQI